MLFYKFSTTKQGDNKIGQGLLTQPFPYTTLAYVEEQTLKRSLYLRLFFFFRFIQMLAANVQPENNSCVVLHRANRGGREPDPLTHEAETSTTRIPTSLLSSRNTVRFHRHGAPLAVPVAGKCVSYVLCLSDFLVLLLNKKKKSYRPTPDPKRHTYHNARLE